VANRPISQQTSATVPLQGELARAAPRPHSLRRATFSRRLQWALEGPGSSLLGAALEFTLLCVAVVVAIGGPQAALHPSAVRAPLLALPPLVMLLFYPRGLYRTRLRAAVLDGVFPVVGAVSVATMIVAALGLLVNGSLPMQSDWVRAWFFALLAVGVGRTALHVLQRWARSHRLVGKPVLIMGAGLVGSQMARRLESHPEFGLSPVGFLDSDPRSVAEVGGRDIPVLGMLEDLEDAVQSTGVKNLIVAFSSVADARVSRLVQRCQELGIEVSVVPRMFDMMNSRTSYETVGGLPLLTFRAVNPKGLQFAIKYAMDRFFAGVLLLALSPLLAVVALAVKLTNDAPLLFRQPRVGLDGHEFEMLKFRTMRGTPDDNGESDAGWADRILNAGGLDHDDTFIYAGQPDGVTENAVEDRRTLVGRFLRRTSLDELPQLWNVLNGDMSLIGPRPERASYVRLFEGVVHRYGDRHRVKSGITGWAQVHGLRGQTSLAERVEWDNFYILNWSLGLDLKILALTCVALVRNAD
jgi:exopolysaccharide biosynthesis polyprenyl glycosylphosphotransferase